MNTTTDTLRVEVSVDLQNAAASEALATVYSRRATVFDSIHRFAGSKVRYTSRGRKAGYEVSDAEALATARQRLADATSRDWRTHAAEDGIARIEGYDAEIAAIREVQEELTAIFVAWGRWNRFFLVPGGHIHSSTACHSCRPTTAFGWLPELSGLTEADAVKAYGPTLCSFCFPSAPVEWTVEKNKKGGK
jgi:hypothetical protein